MTSEQFCYWLQGRAEMQPDTPPSDAEWKMIREHLATVFVKVTPPLQIPNNPGWVPNQGGQLQQLQWPGGQAPVAIC